MSPGTAAIAHRWSCRPPDGPAPAPGRAGWHPSAVSRGPLAVLGWLLGRENRRRTSRGLLSWKWTAEGRVCPALFGRPAGSDRRGLRPWHRGGRPTPCVPTRCVSKRCMPGRPRRRPRQLGDREACQGVCGPGCWAVAARLRTEISFSIASFTSLRGRPLRQPGPYGNSLFK